MRASLFEALGRGVDVRFGSTIAAFAQNGDVIDVTLNDGSRERADLLVGADGVHSRVRGLAFGDDTRFVRQLGYHTAAFVFEDDALQAEIGNSFATLLAQVIMPSWSSGRVVLVGDRPRDRALVRSGESNAPRDTRRGDAHLRLAHRRVAPEATDLRRKRHTPRD